MTASAAVLPRHEAAPPRRTRGSVSPARVTGLGFTPFKPHQVPVVPSLIFLLKCLNAEFLEDFSLALFCLSANVAVPINGLYSLCKEKT